MSCAGQGRWTWRGGAPTGAVQGCSSDNSCCLCFLKNLFWSMGQKTQEQRCWKVYGTGTPILRQFLGCHVTGPLGCAPLSVWGGGTSPTRQRSGHLAERGLYSPNSSAKRSLWSRKQSQIQPAGTTKLERNWEPSLASGTLITPSLHRTEPEN